MHEMYSESYEADEYALLQAGANANPDVKYEFYRKFFNIYPLAFLWPTHVLSVMSLTSR